MRLWNTLCAAIPCMLTPTISWIEVSANLFMFIYSTLSKLFNIFIISPM